MSDTISPIAISNFLEESGTLGGIAALALLSFIDDQPAAFSAVPNGFMFSKSYPFLADAPPEVPLTDFLTLRSTGAAFTLTLGVHKENGSYKHINVMITALGQDGQPGLELVFGKGVLRKADVVKSPEGNVIGYENANQELTIPLPIAAFEFCFDITEEEGGENEDVDENGVPYVVHVPEIQPNDPDAPAEEDEEEDYEFKPTGFIGSVKIHHLAGQVTDSVLDGILELDFGSVIILPWLGNTGIYIDRLLMDWSEENMGSFADSFPQIYGPEWKGFAASELSIIVPLSFEDQQNPDFLVASATNFLWDCDGQISVKAAISYQNNEENALINHINGTLEIYENNPIRSSASLWLNFGKASEKMADKGAEKANSEGTTINVNSARGDINSQASRNPKSYLLGFNVKFVHFFCEERDYFMYEFNLLGIREKQGVEVYPNIFSDKTHQYLNSALAFGAGCWMLYKGISEDDALYTFGGSALIPLSVLEFLYPEDGPDMIDIIKQLQVHKIGIRLATFTHNNEEKFVLDLLLDFEVGVNFDQLVIAKVLEGLLTLFGIADPGPVELFGESMDRVLLNGNLTVKFSNVQIPFFDEIPAELKTVFGVKPLAITATEIPTISIKENPNDSEGPKDFEIHTETRFITKNINDETHYGLTFGITGLTVAGVSAMAAIKGFTLFLYPKIDFVLDFEFKLPSEIVMFYPGAFLAKGRLEIDKPLPASNGSLNLISVEVGILARPQFASLDPKDYKKYLDINAYQYQGMGTVAFGDASIQNADHSVTDNYSFWYSSFYLQFAQPIPFPTPAAGVSGFGGLFGLNVSPGKLGEGAEGISNWIKQTDDFSDVLRWNDGNTNTSWHPNKSYDNINQEFDSIYNLGLVLAMADVPTQGATMRGQGLLLIEISFDPGFLRSFSLGARLLMPKIGLNALVLLVVDPNGFVMTIDFSLRYDKESGNIYKLRFPIEFGFYKKKSWTYVGHYLDSKGGPATADILNNLFQASFFVVYSSETLESFGLNPFNDDSRIDLPGPAFGYGVLYKFGPKQYGPSWLHLKLFAALGVNFGFHMHEEEDGRNEMMAFGEGFAGGALTLKVIFIKFEISLMAVMNFIFNNNGYRIFGELVFKLSMPWPFDDIRAGVDFIIQSDGFLPIPPVSIDAILTGQSRMVLESVELSGDSSGLLPIDSALVLKFSRKVNNELLYNPTLIPDGNGATTLAINDHDGLDGAVFEEVITEYQKQKYLLQFNHQIENLRISVLQNGEFSELVSGMFATWGLPALDENNQAIHDDEENKTLYIGTLFPYDEQFSAERFGNFHAWYVQNQHKSPCEIFTPVCISAIPIIDPVIDNELEIIEDWSIMQFQGTQSFGNPLNYIASDTPELITRPGPFDRHQFLLPHRTRIDLIQSKRTTLHLEFEFNPNMEIDLPGPRESEKEDVFRPNVIKSLSEYIDHFRIFVTASLVDGSSIGALIQLRPVKITPDEPVEFTSEFFPFGISDNDSINDVEFDELQILDNRIEFKVDFSATQQAYFIKRIDVTGWQAVTKANSVISSRDQEVLRQALKNCKLYCNELCVYKKDINDQWFDPTGFGDDNLDQIEANSTELMDTIQKYHLFKANTTYRVDYAVRTHVKVFHMKDYDQGETDNELVAQKDLISSTYGDAYPQNDDSIHPRDITQIDPFEFSTEVVPSQDVDLYVGFHFPAPGAKLLYPQQTSPTLALKYRSLIRRIFSIHEEDEDVLTPRLIHTKTREEITFDIQGVRIRNSNAADQYTEAALECAAAVDQMNYMDIYVLSRALETESDYTLQLFYNGENDSIDPVQYNAPFSTSAFMNLTEHGAHVNGLIRDAIQEPLTEGANSIAAVQTLIDDALQSPEKGNDVLIETIYQNALGLPDARRFESSEDGAFWAVSLENGTPEFWGIFIELKEPIVKKSGVTLQESSNQSNEDAGIYIMLSGLLIVADLNGTRLGIFRIDQNNNIIPFADNAESIHLESSNAQIWEEMVRNYVVRQYTMLTNAERNDLIDEILGELDNAASANLNSDSTAFSLSILKPNTP